MSGYVYSFAELCAYAWGWDMVRVREELGDYQFSGYRALRILHCRHLGIPNSRRSSDAAVMRVINAAAFDRWCEEQRRAFVALGA